MAVDLAISNWSGWTTPMVPLAPGTALRVSETPDASAIPAMLRRRLDTLGRAVAAEMLRHGESLADTPVVYGSRHGDLERTLDVLSDLARDEPVSPMHFSLSVHNAITGIVSIHSGITANITSIAALDECLVPVLLEAAGLVRETAGQVMCVIADAPVPAIYRRDCCWPAAPFAASFLVGPGDGLAITLDRADRDTATADDALEALPQALRFIEFLASGQRTFSTPHNGGDWTIARH